MLAISMLGGSYVSRLVEEKGALAWGLVSMLSGGYASGLAEGKGREP